MTDLLNCPFCGTPAHVPDPSPRMNGGETYSVVCVYCDFQLESGTEQQAIAAWNRRTITAGSVAVPVDFVRFLLGSESHDGVWFHDLHPTRQGRYWWRKDLQAMLAAAQVSA